MFEEVIAESTLLKHVMRLHQALEAWELKAIEQLLKAPANNVEVTSRRVDKSNHRLTRVVLEVAEVLGANRAIFAMTGRKNAC